MSDAANTPTGPRRQTDGLPSVPADADTIGRMVANYRRRRTLEYVDNEGVVTLGDAADHIALQEFDEPLAHQERQRVYIDLYQNHLDELAAVGAVHWKKEQKRIVPGPCFDGFLAASEFVEALGGDRDE